MFFLPLSLSLSLATTRRTLLRRRRRPPPHRPPDLSCASAPGPTPAPVGDLSALLKGARISASWAPASAALGTAALVLAGGPEAVRVGRAARAASESGARRAAEGEAGVAGRARHAPRRVGGQRRHTNSAHARRRQNSQRPVSVWSQTSVILDRCTVLGILGG